MGVHAINSDKKTNKVKRKYENNLNVFTYGYMPWKYPRNWFSNIRNFFDNFKKAWDRATKGYCWWDRCDLDIFYLNLMRDSIYEFSAKTHSWPDKYFETFEEWQEFLTNLSEKLDKAMKDPSDLNPYTDEYDKFIFMDSLTEEQEKEKKEIISKYIEEDKRIIEEQHKLIEEIFAEIGKYIQDLWD